MTEWQKGSELSPATQEECKRTFAHRFTRAMRPGWARSNPSYTPQFADDTDWLANTLFAVRKNGQLDRRYGWCQSSPTWPDGKGAWGSPTET